MFELPPWEPYIELCCSIIILIVVSFLLFIITTSQLHFVIRALLCTNAIAVLVVAVGQLSFAMWCIQGSRLMEGSEFYFFAPIMMHQCGYYMCACSFLLITSERLLLCYKPNFYEAHKISFTAAFCLSLAIELSIVAPVVITMQYESLSVFCATFVGIQEFVSFSLLINCYRKSSLYYVTKFANVNLNSRYQVRGVIELTRAFIPIITSGLSVKALMFILTIASLYTEDFIETANFLLRLACTVYSICLPFLLIFRVKTLRKRFASFFPTNSSQPKTSCTQQNARTATEKYFEELKKQWG